MPALVILISPARGRAHPGMHGPHLPRHRRRVLRGDGRRDRPAGARMSASDAVFLAISLAVLAYLAFALLRGERL